jgi:glucose-1-phosphate thymidylyltransferase
MARSQWLCHIAKVIIDTPIEYRVQESPRGLAEIARNIQPSARGEIEITAVLGRGMAWLDTGTYDGLLEAANFIATIQKRQGLYVSCIEEIAYTNGWISRDNILTLAAAYKTEYGQYLAYIATE